VSEISPGHLKKFQLLLKKVFYWPPKLQLYGPPYTSAKVVQGPGWVWGYFLFFWYIKVVYGINNLLMYILHCDMPVSLFAFNAFCRLIVSSQHAQQALKTTWHSGLNM
jgi:hypothetical protein